MKKQILTLLMGAAVFTTSPVYGMEAPEESDGQEPRAKYKQYILASPGENIHDPFSMCEKCTPVAESTAGKHYTDDFFFFGSACLEPSETKKFNGSDDKRMMKMIMHDMQWSNLGTHRYENDKINPEWPLPKIRTVEKLNEDKNDMLKGPILQKPGASLNEQTENVKVSLVKRLEESLVKRLEEYKEIQRSWEEIKKTLESQSNTRGRHSLGGDTSRRVDEITFEEDSFLINADEELSKISKEIQHIQNLLPYYQKQSNNLDQQ